MELEGDMRRRIGYAGGKRITGGRTGSRVSQKDLQRQFLRRILPRSS